MPRRRLPKRKAKSSALRQRSQISKGERSRRRVEAEFRCPVPKCTENLVRTTVRSAYRKTEMVEWSCDECGKVLNAKSAVFHCAPSGVHREGYDLCVDCGVQLNAADSRDTDIDSDSDNALAEDRGFHSDKENARVDSQRRRQRHKQSARGKRQRKRRSSSLGAIRGRKAKEKRTTHSESSAMHASGGLPMDVDTEVVSEHGDDSNYDMFTDSNAQAIFTFPMGHFKAKKKTSASSSSSVQREVDALCMILSHAYMHEMVDNDSDDASEEQCDDETLLKLVTGSVEMDGECESEEDESEALTRKQMSERRSAEKRKVAEITELRKRVKDTGADIGEWQRRKAFVETMRTVDATIDGCVEAADTQVFADISEFCAEAYQSECDELLRSCLRHVLPTAVLSTHSGDSSLHFDKLAKLLERDVTPFVVRLTSAIGTGMKDEDSIDAIGDHSSAHSSLFAPEHCGSNSLRTVDKTMRFIVETVLDTCRTLASRITDGGLLDSRLKSSSFKKTHDHSMEEMMIDATKEKADDCLSRAKAHLPSVKSMRYEYITPFAEWFAQCSASVCELYPYQKAARTVFDGRPKIIVLVDSIDSMSPKVLALLIEALHVVGTANGCVVPFVLVFGTAIGEHTLAIALDDAYELLHIAAFELQSSLTAYRTIAETVLFDASPLLFDDSVVSELLANCEYYDHSIARFAQQIRCLYLHHFDQAPGSQLVNYLLYLRKHSRAESRTKQWREFAKWATNDADIGRVYEMLATTRKYVAVAEKAKREKVGSKMAMRLAIFEALNDFDSYKRRYEKCCAVIHELLEFLGRKNLSAADLRNALQNHRSFEESFLSATNQRSNILWILKSAKHFEDFLDWFVTKTEAYNGTRVVSFVDEIRGKIAVAKSKQSSFDISKPAATKRTKRSQLKAGLKTQTVGHLLQIYRKEVAALIMDFVRTHLREFEEFPLTQLLVVKGADSLRRALCVDYGRGLREGCAQTRSFAVAYNIWSECGAYMNIADMYDSFEAQMWDEDEKGPIPEGKQMSLQTVFWVCLDDLRHLQLAKPGRQSELTKLLPL